MNQSYSMFPADFSMALYPSNKCLRGVFLSTRDQFQNSSGLHPARCKQCVVFVSCIVINDIDDVIVVTSSSSSAPVTRASSILHGLCPLGMSRDCLV